MQRLNKFQERFNNSRSDMIFMIDVSGSVSNSGFRSEKEFVNSLLSKISVQPIATRVSVITFGYSVQRDIDYIDYSTSNRDRSTMNKCHFNKEFNTKVKHRYGRATNMNGAFKKAKEILDRAIYHKIKRNNVNTVVFLLTDGHYNQGGDPLRLAQELRNRNGKYDVEIFSVGIGWHLQGTLERLAGSSDNVVYARNFADFSGLASRIRGGMSFSSILLCRFKFLGLHSEREWDVEF